MEKEVNETEFIVVMRNKGSMELCDDNLNIYFESEDSLLDNLIDFSDYFYDIKRLVEKEHLPDSDTTIKQTYMESSFKTGKDDDLQPNIESFLKSWLEDPSQKQIGLLGEFGQGKSTCALMFAYHLINSKLPLRIPIIIELRGKSPMDLTVEELLSSWAWRYNYNVNALKKLLTAGRLLIIFEGFDEMSNSGTMEKRIEHCRTLWRFCYAKAKILISGRPNFFLDDNEMKRALGIAESTSNQPYCQEVHLQPFNIEQIEQALRAIDRRISDEIIEFAKDNAKFREIASRASTLFQISLIWEREGLLDKKNLINSAYVMKLYIKYSYDRQTAKIDEERRFMSLNAGERAFYMSGIAAYMAANNLPNQISTEQLNDVVAKLYETGGDIKFKSSAMSLEDTRSLKDRIGEEEDRIDVIRTDVHRGGLLVTDLSKQGCFKFAHKSFMEYLSAEVVYLQMIKADLNPDESKGINAIIKSTQINLSSLIKYNESLEYFVELLTAELKFEDEEDFARSLLMKIRKGFALPKLIFYSMSSFVILRYLENSVRARLARLFLSVQYNPRVSILYLSSILAINPILLFGFNFIYVNTYSTLLIWKKCCDALGIKDKTINKILGKDAAFALDSIIHKY
ncbi:MAG: hypothetical protein HQ591_05380 [candidate division Zixibacteria bacterium]|nr:hypothetical protein [Candidatus Tariuqbacter arcticus]